MSQKQSYVHNKNQQPKQNIWRLDKLQLRQNIKRVQQDTMKKESKMQEKAT